MAHYAWRGSEEGNFNPFCLKSLSLLYMISVQNILADNCFQVFGWFLLGQYGSATSSSRLWRRKTDPQWKPLHWASIMGWFVISRFQDCKDLKVHHWSRIGFSSPGLPGFQGLSSPGFQGSLLEQVWICDLEVHQQVAARAIDVATVTLKRNKIIVMCIYTIKVLIPFHVRVTSILVAQFFEMHKWQKHWKGSFNCRQIRKYAKMQNLFSFSVDFNKTF